MVLEDEVQEEEEVEEEENQVENEVMVTNEIEEMGRKRREKGMGMMRR